MNLEIGDIIFTFKKGNLFSKLIYAFSIWKKNTKNTTPKISHALVYIGNGLICEASFGGIEISSILKYDNAKYSVEYQRLINNIDEKQKQMILDYCYEIIGKIKYWHDKFIVLSPDAPPFPSSLEWFPKLYNQKIDEGYDIAKNAISKIF